MKLGFLTQVFDNPRPPDPQGSIGIWTWETARRLARSREVIVVGPRLQGGPTVEKLEGVNFRRFPLTADHLRSAMRRFTGFAPPAEVPEFASDSYYPVYAGRAANAFQREGCSVVHVHNFSQFVPIIRSVSRRTKIVLHMHCDWLVQLDRQVINGRLRQADAIVGCSEYVTSNIRTAFPQYADRCATVFNGVDVEKITVSTGRSRDRRSPRVVFVGRVSPEKGLHVLIDAFERVLNKRPESHLEIIGGEFVMPLQFTVGISDDPMVQSLCRFYSGSYLDSLRAQVNGRLGGRVTFLGHIPRAEMIEHVRQADLFVQPSIASEMFGLAVAEAMAAGVPVVATRICGLPELVADGETGLLVRPGDPEALAEAIIHLLNDSNLSERMGGASRARVERLFSWDKTVAALEHVCRSEHLQVKPKKCARWV